MSDLLKKIATRLVVRALLACLLGALGGLAIGVIISQIGQMEPKAAYVSSDVYIEGAPLARVTTPPDNTRPQAQRSVTDSKSNVGGTDYWCIDPEPLLFVREGQTVWGVVSQYMWRCLPRQSVAQHERMVWYRVDALEKSMSVDLDHVRAGFILISVKGKAG